MNPLSQLIYSTHTTQKIKFSITFSILIYSTHTTQLIYSTHTTQKIKFSIKCQCCPHIEISQLTCTASQLTDFYMRATLALNGLNINCDTIYRTNYLCIVNLKVLPTSYIRYNWDKKKYEILVSKNEAEKDKCEVPYTNYVTKRLENFDKIIGFQKSFSPFIFKSLHTHFNPSQCVSFSLSLNGLVKVTSKGSRFLANVSNKEM